MAARALIFLLLSFVSLQAQIALQDTIVTIDTDGGSTHTTGTVPGGTDYTHFLMIHIRGDDDVTDVSGGSLTWTEQVDACADNGQTGSHIYSAQGSATSFTVSVTLSSVSASVISHVRSYTGVSSTFEDAHWENEYSGEGTSNPGACASGDKTSPATFTIGNTSADSWFLLMYTGRTKDVTSGAEDAQNVVQDEAGSGGDAILLRTSDVDRGATTGDKAYSWTLSGTEDWSVLGLVMQEEAAAGGGARYQGGVITIQQ